MKPVLHLVQQAALAVALLSVVCPFGPYGLAEACNEAADLGGGLAGANEADGFLVDFDNALALPIHSLPVACPTPPCTNTSCTTVNPATPFVRLPGYESAPIFDRAGCFGVTKRDANFYVQLTLDGSGMGIHRHVSTDGGFTWTEGPVVIPKTANWWRGLKCPDPHFLSTSGDMVVYFKATATNQSGVQSGIARAVSTDDGVTWTADPAPVLTSGAAGKFVDNPSVIQRGPNLWMMAYTVGCVGESAPFQLAETHLATSPDGITWTKSPLNPAIVPGACGEWDQGAIANPVLMNDPNHANVLHLFYTGADWNGTTTRGCAKIGHAISTDSGRNWCKTGVVLDRPAATSVAWDDGQFMVSSYTLEANNKIRMYYWAQGGSAGDPVGLGIAEADWPLAGCGPRPEADRSVGFADLPAGDLDEILDGSLPYLRSQPNPTSGQTRIEHNLSQGRFDGAGSVKVFDVRGREIARVWSGRLDEAPAVFEWNGLDGGGNRVAAGRYLIRLEEGGTPLATSWITVTPSR